MSLAPIAFFAYKRPEHTKRSLESLSQNEWAELSELFIYCDAAKHPEDIEAVKEVREVAKSKQWCGKVHIIEHEINLGCNRSIVYGITQTCQQYGKVIVVEDDLIISSYFLSYMNTALDLYQDNDQVMQISGYMFPVDLKDAKTDALFLPFTTSWGWATWQRAWQNFDPEMKAYEQLKSDKKLRHRFDLYGAYPYFNMLQVHIEKNIDTWDIQWYLSTFMLNGLTLYPKNSLVQNIGFDGSGTHCGISSNLDTEIYQDRILSMPTNIQSDNKVANIVFAYLCSLNQPPSLLEGINRRFTNLFYKIKQPKS